MFQDSYISLVLSVGLPRDFDNETDYSSVGSNRSFGMSAEKEKPGNYLELRLFSNLKSFFAERSIESSDYL